MDALKGARGMATEVLRPYIPPCLTTFAVAPTFDPATEHGEKLDRIVRLYRGLPKGEPKHNVHLKRSGMFANYYNKHLAWGAGRATLWPIVHLMALASCVSYCIQYSAHLKYHKNRKFH